MIYRSFNLLTTLILITIFWQGGGVALAKTPKTVIPQAATGKFYLRQKHGRMVLKVTDMPLTNVLKAVARKKHIPIHYTNVPDVTVTNLCEGADIRQLLDCVLDYKADLIVRTHPKNRYKISEIWVSMSNAPSETVQPEGQEGKYGLDEPAEAKLAIKQQLLEQVQSPNPQVRTQALASLLTLYKGDLDVQAVLEQALTDDNPEVRAQAVSTLTQRLKEAEADAVVEQGMMDESVDVRLMAVEGNKDNRVLLQKALTDKDEAVRSLAAEKLKILMKRDMNPQ